MWKLALVATAAALLATPAAAQKRYWYDGGRGSIYDQSWETTNSYRAPNVQPKRNIVSPLLTGSGDETGGPARERLSTTGSIKKFHHRRMAKKHYIQRRSARAY